MQEDDGRRVARTAFAIEEIDAIHRLPSDLQRFRGCLRREHKEPSSQGSQQSLNRSGHSNILLEHVTPTQLRREVGDTTRRLTTEKDYASDEISSFELRRSADVASDSMTSIVVASGR